MKLNRNKLRKLILNEIKLLTEADSAVEVEVSSGKTSKVEIVNAGETELKISMPIGYKKIKFQYDYPFTIGDKESFKEKSKPRGEKHILTANNTGKAYYFNCKDAGTLKIRPAR